MKEILKVGKKFLDVVGSAKRLIVTYKAGKELKEVVEQNLQESVNPDGINILSDEEKQNNIQKEQKELDKQQKELDKLLAWQIIAETLEATNYNYNFFKTKENFDIQQSIEEKQRIVKNIQKILENNNKASKKIIKEEYIKSFVTDIINKNIINKKDLDTDDLLMTQYDIIYEKINNQIKDKINTTAQNKTQGTNKSEKKEGNTVSENTTQGTSSENTTQNTNEPEKKEENMSLWKRGVSGIKNGFNFITSLGVKRILVTATLIAGAVTATIATGGLATPAVIGAWSFATAATAAYIGQNVIEAKRAQKTEKRESKNKMAQELLVGKDNLINDFNSKYTGVDSVDVKKQNILLLASGYSNLYKDKAKAKASDSPETKIKKDSRLKKYFVALGKSIITNPFTTLIQIPKFVIGLPGKVYDTTKEIIKTAIEGTESTLDFVTQIFREKLLTDRKVKVKDNLKNYKKVLGQDGEISEDSLANVHSLFKAANNIIDNKENTQENTEENTSLLSAKTKLRSEEMHNISKESRVIRNIKDTMKDKLNFFEAAKVGAEKEEEEKKRSRAASTDKQRSNVASAHYCNSLTNSIGKTHGY